ncbi:MAG: hypothetical protein VKI82_09610 [Leptolyngbya sp.]|nr:hypothetical protein [Leptolyngbya sp.]
MSTPILKDYVSTDQNLNDQRLKDQILAEIDHLSGEALTQVLTYVQSLNPESAVSPSTSTLETANSAPSATASTDEVLDSPAESAFLKGYQRSKHNREEVYRRLADS